MVNKQSSRINNAFKNVSLGSILQIVALIMSFVSRTFFVKILGNDYLSCDGLFSNVLTILSFTELGIGSAIIYSLYKPIAESDYEQIGKLMNLFATAYRYITVIIAAIGVCIIPALRVIINDVPDVQESITLIYCLFLANTIASYIYGYKRSFLIANQENYIVLSIQQVCNLLKLVLQILFLVLTHDYILYLIINIFATLVSNVISTRIADKKYPWIRLYEKEKLLKDERKPVFSNIFSIAQYKLGAVILNGTDNIIISAFIKTSYVGLYSNYNLIINAVSQIINQACGGLQATIGNHNVESDEKHRYDVFKKLYFISFWSFGFFSVSLCVLLNPFIGDVWLGKDYLLDQSVVVALAVSFYVNVINTIPSTYRTTLGFFKEARFCPIMASVLNIALSIIFAKIIGLSGVFWATIIARFFTFNIIDPVIVFRHGFRLRPIKYFTSFAGYSFILVVDYCLTNYAVSAVTIDGFGGFIVKILLDVIVCNGVLLLFLFKMPTFKEVLKTVRIYFPRGK